MKLGTIAALVSLAAGGCKGKTDDAAAGSGSGAGSGSSAVAVSAPPAAAKPGTLNLASIAPLGAADAIEPPTREIVPGMSIADAKAKGAKADTVDYTLTWKPDLDLWIDKTAGIVTKLEVTYKKADYDAASAKWGKPNFGEAWLGANWLASLNGCQGDCTVTFERSPLALLGATPVPPLGLASLTATSSLADLAKLVGVPIVDRSGVETGFGVNLAVDPSDQLVEAIVISDNTGRDDARWTAVLEKLWGKPTAIGDKTAWLSADKHWAVETGQFGDTLRYTPLVPAKDEMTSVRALPLALWNKPKAAIAAVPHMKDDELALPTTEWSFGGQSYSGAHASVQYDDKGVVEQLHISLAANAESIKQLVPAFEAMWGKPIKSKTPDGEDQLTLTVDGIAFVVEIGESSIELDASRPEPPTP